MAYARVACAVVPKRVSEFSFGCQWAKRVAKEIDAAPAYEVFLGACMSKASCREATWPGLTILLTILHVEEMRFAGDPDPPLLTPGSSTLLTYTGTQESDAFADDAWDRGVALTRNAAAPFNTAGMASPEAQAHELLRFYIIFMRQGTFNGPHLHTVATMGGLSVKSIDVVPLRGINGDASLLVDLTTAEATSATIAESLGVPSFCIKLVQGGRTVNKVASGERSVDGGVVHRPSATALVITSPTGQPAQGSICNDVDDHWFNYVVPAGSIDDILAMGKRYDLAPLVMPVYMWLRCEGPGAVYSMWDMNGRDTRLTLCYLTLALAIVKANTGYCDGEVPSHSITLAPFMAFTADYVFHDEFMKKVAGKIDRYTPMRAFYEVLCESIEVAPARHAAIDFGALFPAQPLNDGVDGV